MPYLPVINCRSFLLHSSTTTHFLSRKAFCFSPLYCLYAVSVKIMYRKKGTAKPGPSPCRKFCGARMHFFIFCTLNTSQVQTLRTVEQPIQTESAPRKHRREILTIIELLCRHPIRTALLFLRNKEFICICHFHSVHTDTSQHMCIESKESLMFTSLV